MDVDGSVSVGVDVDVANGGMDAGVCDVDAVEVRDVARDDVVLGTSGSVVVDTYTHASVLFHASHVTCM